MQAAGFVAHCPYEVGDKVNITLHGGIGIVGGTGYGKVRRGNNNGYIGGTFR